MEENGWSLARRLESWPPPSLSRAISDAGSSEAAPTFVARQPIYDRRLEVFGYEMLFRGADVASAEFADDNAATASTVVTTIADIGLESLVGARTCFVNVTREFILNEFATLLPSDRVALELGRGVAADADVRAKLVELREKGYRIVLDDFVLRDDSMSLLEIADMVKLDALSFSDEQLVDQARELTAQGVRLVAERIENHEAFDRCKEAGFELFQGYFFCQPKTVTGKGVPANRLAQMELVVALQNPDVELEELDRVISRDLGVSYRLLRFVNSAYFSLPRRVDSVHDAIILLGSRNVRSWAMLLTLAEIDDQPSELVRTAMVRAKMGERIASATGHGRSRVGFHRRPVLGARRADEHADGGRAVRAAAVAGRQQRAAGGRGPAGRAALLGDHLRAGRLRLARQRVARCRRDPARRLPRGDALGRRGDRRLVRPRLARRQAEAADLLERSDPVLERRVRVEHAAQARAQALVVAQRRLDVEVRRRARDRAAAACGRRAGRPAPAPGPRRRR